MLWPLGPRPFPWVALWSKKHKEDQGVGDGAFLRVWGREGKELTDVVLVSRQRDKDTDLGMSIVTWQPAFQNKILSKPPSSTPPSHSPACSLSLSLPLSLSLRLSDWEADRGVHSRGRLGLSITQPPVDPSVLCHTLIKTEAALRSDFSGKMRQNEPTAPGSCLFHIKIDLLFTKVTPCLLHAALIQCTIQQLYPLAY